VGRQIRSKAGASSLRTPALLRDGSCLSALCAGAPYYSKEVGSYLLGLTGKGRPVSLPGALGNFFPPNPGHHLSLVNIYLISTGDSPFRRGRDRVEYSFNLPQNSISRLGTSARLR
jgi:hypothetical protein